MSRFMLGSTVVASLISLMAHASPIATLDKRLMTVFTVQPDTLGEWAVEDSYGRHTTEPFKSFKSVDYREFSACLLECAQNTACEMLQWTGGHPTAGSATQESQLPTCKLYKDLNMQSVGPMDPEAPDGECLMARLGDHPNPNPKSPSYKVELTWAPATPVASLEKRDMQVFTVQNNTRGTWTDSRGILAPLAIHESPNFTGISSCMALCVQDTGQCISIDLLLVYMLRPFPTLIMSTMITTSL
ncbi:hypothetical protein FFLO_03626 [Filobasidium floriforme]|uniref:Apple domain-containing protein n=1 Tax=Filobasidium floriforme TaxID=5210 RepID=A0A8K0JKC0_9TREE|nr:hypothetical protein FFLO_03626 [Filobasidium floriforme]